MTTTDDLRRELRSVARPTTGLDPRTVLAAGRRHRRRRRVTGLSAATGVAALAVGGSFLVDPPRAPVAPAAAGPAYASTAWTATDDGGFLFDSTTSGFDGKIEAYVDAEDMMCVAVRYASICTNEEHAITSRHWAQDLLVVVATEPVATAEITADGRALRGTVFSFPEHPELRFVATLLGADRHFTSDVSAEVVGRDESGAVVLERRIDGRAVTLPRNQNGQTYGDVVELGGSRTIPDLVAVTTDDGRPGYALATDVAQGLSPGTTDDLMQLLAGSAPRGTTEVPVVAVDGVTPLGTATVPVPDVP